MKTLILILIFLTASSTGFAANIYWISTVSSNWNNTANWSAASGGVSCGCTPTVADVVIFDGAGGANGRCVLDIAPSVGAIQMIGYTGIIALNGNSLAVGGLTTNNIFNTGLVSGSGTVNITATSAVSFMGTDFTLGADFRATLTTSTGVFTGGGAGTAFDDVVNVTAYSVLLNGCIYNGTTSFIKTGNSNDFGTGANIFNGVTTIRNNSRAILRTSDVAGDIFNNTVHLFLSANNNNGLIQVAYGTGTSTTFNGNIVVTSVNNGFNTVGIFFGQGGGISQLNDGFTIAEGDTLSGEGFERGTLEIRNLTQVGSSAPQTLRIIYGGSPGSASAVIFRVASSIFNANVNFHSSNQDLNGCIFNGANNAFVKRIGGGTSNLTGGNVFNGNVVFRNFASSSLNIGTTAGDDFNGDVTFVYYSSGSIFRLGQHDTNDDITTIAGNISVIRGGGSSANLQVRFVESNFGRVVLDGNTDQTITVYTRISGSDFYYSFDFNNVEINKTGGSVVLANSIEPGVTSPTNPILVSGDLTFTNGIVQPISTVFFNFLDGATAIGASDNSFVDGLVQKTGDDDGFAFPVGDGGVYRPIAISAPATVTSVFSAEYTLNNHGLGINVTAPLVIVSTCEFWTLNRVIGADNVNVTLSWNQDVFCNASYVTVPADLRVAQWGAASWNNLGNGGFINDATLGTVTSSSPVSAFGTFTLASVIPENVLPIELSFIKAELKNNNVEIKWQTASESNNDYFTVERNEQGLNGFETLATIQAAGTSTQVNNYSWVDEHPLSGQYYYRVKQTDFDGTETYSKIITVLIKRSDLEQGMPYPNPIVNTLFLDRLNASDESIVEVIDMTGHLAYRGKFKSSLNFESLPSGVYILRLSTNSQVQQFRLLKK